MPELDFTDHGRPLRKYGVTAYLRGTAAPTRTPKETRE